MTNSLVDQQVAVVDIDGGPEGVNSLDFLSFPTACLKKSKGSDNFKYKISHNPSRPSLSPKNRIVARPILPWKKMLEKKQLWFFLNAERCEEL